MININNIEVELVTFEEIKAFWKLAEMGKLDLPRGLKKYESREEHFYYAEQFGLKIGVCWVNKKLNFPIFVTVCSYLGEYLMANPLCFKCIQCHNIFSGSTVRDYDLYYMMADTDKAYSNALKLPYTQICPCCGFDNVDGLKFLVINPCNSPIFEHFNNCNALEK